MKSLSNSLLFFPGLFLLILLGIPISSTFVVVVVFFFFFGQNMREIIVFLVYVFHIFTCGLKKKKKPLWVQVFIVDTHMVSCSRQFVASVLICVIS